MESNKKIIGYDVIQVMIPRVLCLGGDGVRPGLIVIVNKKIKEGWIPQGGVSVTISSTNYMTYSQAIIKYES